MSNNRKTALITGSSGGIGYEFAKLLAAKNYDLILTSRSLEKLNSVKDELEKDYGISCKVITADLSKKGEAEKLYNNCRGLKVDILINNAGAGVFGSVTEMDYKYIEDMMFLNIQSLTALCALFGRDFKERKSGNILNVGSMAGNQPTPFFASYAASKSYVLNYSLALREELKPFNINVSCLQPGYVRTAFDENSLIKSESYKKFSYKNSLSADRVAKIGINLMLKKRAYCIAGFKNRITALLTGLLGKTVQAKILHLAIKKIAV